MLLSDETRNGRMLLSDETRNGRMLLSDETRNEELNGLRYAAGYVPRALMKKISRSKDSNRTDILQCLSDLSSDGSEPDNSSSDWINLVNCGGLMCINNITFELFLAMEYELRSHIGAENICKEAASHIKTSEDVLFLWDIISTNWEENVASLLLNQMVQLWIQIRGFSYASAWVEMYKVTHKKTTQKSKGLRKELQTQ